MFLFSSLQYVFKYSNYNKIHNIILSLDTTIITYISLMHIYNNFYINFILCITYFFCKIKFKNIKFHMILILASIIKHILNNNYIIIITQPGLLIFANNIKNNNYFNYEDLFLWHFSVACAIANTFILK